MKLAVKIGFLALFWYATGHAMEITIPVRVKTSDNHSLDISAKIAKNMIFGVQHKSSLQLSAQAAELRELPAAKNEEGLVPEGPLSLSRNELETLLGYVQEIYTTFPNLHDDAAIKASATAQLQKNLLQKLHSKQETIESLVTLIDKAYYLDYDLFIDAAVEAVGEFMGAPENVTYYFHNPTAFNEIFKFLAPLHKDELGSIVAKKYAYPLSMLLCEEQVVYSEPMPAIQTALCMSFNSAVFAYIDQDDNLVVFNRHNGQEVLTVPLGHDNNIITFSPHGTHLLLVDRETGEDTLWDIAAQEVIHTFEGVGVAHDWSHDNQFLALSIRIDEVRRVDIYDLKTNAIVHSHAIPDYIESLHFSKNSTILFLNRMLIWDIWYFSHNKYVEGNVTNNTIIAGDDEFGNNLLEQFDYQQNNGYYGAWLPAEGENVRHVTITERHNSAAQNYLLNHLTLDQAIVLAYISEFIVQQSGYPLNKTVLLGRSLGESFSMLERAQDERWKRIIYPGADYRLNSHAFHEHVKKVQFCSHTDQQWVDALHALCDSMREKTGYDIRPVCERYLEQSCWKLGMPDPLPFYRNKIAARNSLLIASMKAAYNEGAVPGMITLPLVIAASYTIHRTDMPLGPAAFGVMLPLLVSMYSVTDYAQSHPQSSWGRLYNYLKLK